MICRDIINGTVVWFKSIGFDQKVESNYVEEREAIRACVTQKLSVIEQELWFNRYFGLPLFSAGRIKALIDAKIAEEVLAVEGVLSINMLSSKVIKHQYEYVCEINTTYGLITVSSGNI